MSKAPPVSIGLPVYNGETFLAEAIDSILTQSYGDFELVISDNASSDATEAICRDYAARDSRIRFLRQAENLGAAENYNGVFHAARGRYFRWASHDDLLRPGLIEACMNLLDGAPPGVVLVYPRSVLVDAHGERLRDNDDAMDIRESSPSGRFKHVVRSWSLCNAVFGLIRSDALARTGLIRKFVSSDVVLLAELALMGEFWEIPEPLFLRRIHDETSRGGDKTADEAARWFDPKSRGAGWLHPRTQLFFRVMRMVWNADIPAGERAACLTTGSAAWWIRRARVRAGALRRKLAAEG